MRHRFLALAAVAIFAAVVAVIAVGPLAVAGGFQTVASDCSGDKCK